MKCHEDDFNVEYGGQGEGGGGQGSFSLALLREEDVSKNRICLHLKSYEMRLFRR